LIEGKFAYGALSKDLEDEDVSMWLEVGAKWQRVMAERTDRDGRARFLLARERLPSPGRYPYRLVVHGDLSRARGSVWVLPRRAEVVVFDIDGTLTAGGFVGMHLTGHPVLPRQQAAELTHRWRAAGYLPVYLTARPYLYTSYSRAWLETHRFAPGPVIHSDKLGAGLPGHSRAGTFKIGVLRRLVQETGIAIAAAYGDQDSDVCAFFHAGVDPAVTYIWGAARRSCNGSPPAQAIEDYGDRHPVPAAP
jgi:phosphatidate phosphatase PAH1